MIMQNIFFYLSGSISKQIPVTHLQSETLLTTISAVSNQTSISTESPTSSPNLAKAGQKRSALAGSKEKTNRKKLSKKSASSKFQQNFTASLGTQRSGNLLGNRFATPPSSTLNKVSSSQTATLQRLPSGTFVLAGTSGGQVRLQNGNSIVYLQQLTSSGGTTQVIQTPLIANSNGTFSTVPLSSLQQTSLLSNTVTTTTTSTISPSATVPSPLQTSSITTASVIATSPNLNLAASLPSFDTKYTQKTNTSTVATSSQASKHQVQLQNIQTIEEVVTSERSPMSIDASSILPNPTTTTPNLPSSLANLILSLPSVGASGGFSAEANSQAQSILQKLSEDDIKTLSSLLDRYSSTPTSPASSSPVLTPDPEKSPLQSPGLSAPSTPSPIDKSPKISIMATNIASEVKAPKSLATLSKSHQPIQNVRKIPYPLSLTQKVTAIQQDINKMRAPRLKPPRIVTTGLSANKININTSSSATSSSPSVNRALQSKTQKVPITITIPISRLPSSLQFTTSNSKTINVPALSAYLSQQRFVLSAGKSSTNLDSRTVLLSPSNVKKLGSIMVSTNSNKTTSVFSAKATQAITSSSSKSSATITLHLPSQSSQKESSTMKKAASDIKLIGVLNQKTKASQLISASSIKPSSLPSSPITSPASLSPAVGELSPIQPRKSDENTLEPIKPVTTEVPAEPIDESDIDFAVIPGDGTSTLLAQQQSSISTTSVSSVMVSIATVQKHLTSASKIIRVPISSGDRRIFGNKTLIELTKPKQLSENLLLNTARKVGVAFQQKSAETKMENNRNSPADSSILLESGKLRFEPLNNMTSTSRSNLSSVLSSMRETGKIVMDENGQLRNTIVAKPTVVSSKTAAMIARSAFMTDTKLASKSGISFNPLNKSTIASKTTTPALFSGGKGGNSGNHSSIISTPAATIRTATTSGKVLPVTIKSNDFIRMSSQVRAQQHNTTTKHIIPAKIIKREILKSEMKPKPAKKVVVEPKSPEPPKEEPPPYITRSGRVLRTRFSYSDELDRKPSPRKRKRTISNSKEDAIPTSLPATVPVTSTTNSIALLGGSLDSLVEAAKLITTGGAPGDTSIVTSISTSSVPLESNFPTTDATSTKLSNIDSTTNIAATAMLELLSSDTKGLMQSLPLVAEADRVQTVKPAPFSSEKQKDSVKLQPIEHLQSTTNNECVLPTTTAASASSVEFVGDEEAQIVESVTKKSAVTVESHNTPELKFINEEGVRTSDSTPKKTKTTTAVLENEKIYSLAKTGDVPITGDDVQQKQQQVTTISSLGIDKNSENLSGVKQIDGANDKVLHSMSSASQEEIIEKEIEISERLLQEE